MAGGLGGHPGPHHHLEPCLRIPVQLQWPNFGRLGAVPQDDFNGQVYFRRPSIDPQNFPVQVDGMWAASIATKTETDVFLIDTFRSMFPTPLKQVFPYRLFIQPSETQIGAVLHEDFHVFEQRMAPQRLAKAEAAHN